MDSANTYHHLHAGNYDVIYSEKPYKDEARFVWDSVIQLSGRTPQSLLDIACGTGRHAFQFDSFGCSVTGVDLSQDLLDIGIHRAKAAERHIDFMQGDMRNLLDLKRSFDVATCLFDALGYALTDKDIISALSGINKNIKQGGFLALEVIHTPAMLNHYDKTRVRRWKLDGSELIRIAETSVNPLNSTFSVRYCMIELNNNGTFKKTEETQHNRFFTLQEMDTLLDKAGFDRVRVNVGYTPDEKVTDETWHLLIFAKKR